jgi:hypothetical protein
LQAENPDKIIVLVNNHKSVFFKMTLAQNSPALSLVYCCFTYPSDVKPLFRGSKSTGESFGQVWVKNIDFFTILVANLLVLDDLL